MSNCLFCGTPLIKKETKESHDCWSNGGATGEGDV